MNKVKNGNGFNGLSTGVKFASTVLGILVIVLGATFGMAKYVIKAGSNVDSTAREKVVELEKCLTDSISELEKKDALLEGYITSEAEHTQTKIDDLEKLMDVKIEALREDLKEQRIEQRETNKQILDILIEIKKNGKK